MRTMGKFIGGLLGCLVCLGLGNAQVADIYTDCGCDAQRIANLNDAEEELRIRLENCADNDMWC